MPQHVWSSFAHAAARGRPYRKPAARYTLDLARSGCSVALLQNASPIRKSEISRRRCSRALEVDRLIVEHRFDAALAGIAELKGKGFTDPEGFYASALLFAWAGAADAAIAVLREAVRAGYACHVALTRSPEWTRLAGRPDFDAIVADTARMVEDVRRRYDAACGSDVLGVPAG